jgi:hypothetical protein
MKPRIHSAAFFSGSLLLCVVWLWLRPAPPLQSLATPEMTHPAGPPRARVALAAAVLARYAGSYELDSAMSVTMSVEDGRLFAQADGSPLLELFAASATEFFLKDSAVELAFELDAHGSVEGFVVRLPNGNLTAERVR